MFTSTKGIVLRTYPFKDKMCISRVFTRNTGIESFIVKRVKNQLILTQSLNMVDLVFKKKNTSNLLFVKEAQVDYVYQSLNLKAEKIQTSIVLCEILNKIVKEKNPELYDFVTTSLQWLDQSVKCHIGFNSLFLIKLCDFVGISPSVYSDDNPSAPKFLNIADGEFIHLENTKLKKDIVPSLESEMIYALSKIGFDDLNTIGLSIKLNNSIFNYLLLYISRHLTDLSSFRSLKIIIELV